MFLIIACGDVIKSGPVTSNGGNEVASPCLRLRRFLLHVSSARFRNVHTHLARVGHASRTLTCTLREEGGVADPTGTRTRPHRALTCWRGPLSFLCGDAENSERSGCGAAAVRRLTAAVKFCQRAEASEQRSGRTGSAEPAAQQASLQTSAARSRRRSKGSTQLGTSGKCRGSWCAAAQESVTRLVFINRWLDHSRFHRVGGVRIIDPAAFWRKVVQLDLGSDVKCR